MWILGSVLRFRLSGDGHFAKLVLSALSIAAAVTAPMIFHLDQCLGEDSVRIEGRIFADDDPLPAAKLFLHETYADLLSGKHAHESSPTDQNGLYSMIARPGRYYFTAKGEWQNRGFFAYHMNNPIDVEEATMWLTLIAHEMKEPRHVDGDMAVRGMVLFKGHPVPGAYVSVYSAAAPMFKGHGVRTETADEKGAFAISLSSGKYVVVARQMRDGGSLRQPLSGDLAGYFPMNPIIVKPGKDTVIEIPCYSKADRASVIGSPALRDSPANSVPPGSITGLLRVQGKRDPYRGIVAFFNAETGPPPGGGPGKRIPDMKTTLHLDGSFLAALPPGRYHIGFILGRDADKPGPPRAEEVSFTAHGKDDKPLVAVVSSGEILQIGAVSGRKTDIDALPPQGEFTVRGKVIGPDGSPVKDATVIALRRDVGRLHPVYIAPGTGEDGSYSLRLPADREHYLQVRTGAGGGQPQPGEFIGRYGGDVAARPVKGKSGDTLADIDIRLFKIPLPGKSGKSLMNRGGGDNHPAASK